jgi:hypothetical protein
MKQPAIEGACLCGAVRLAAARKPRTVTQCNCSACRRYGTLWAYYTRATATITAPRGAVVRYTRRPRAVLRFGHCATCGCVVCWDLAPRTGSTRLALNSRLLDPVLMASVPIKMLDGDKTWNVLDRYQQPEVFVSPHR